MQIRCPKPRTHTHNCQHNLLITATASGLQTYEEYVGQKRTFRLIGEGVARNLREVVEGNGTTCSSLMFSSRKYLSKSSHSLILDPNNSRCALGDS